MPTLILDDAQTHADLQVYLQRLARVGEPEVRIVSRGAAAAVYGCTQAPLSITDTAPVVLVMRGFGLGERLVPEIDVTVQARSLLDRLARQGSDALEVQVPPFEAIGAWAGVLPPVSGWQPAGTITSGSLSKVAQQGIARVADALPEQPGEAVVQRVRSAVWGAEIAPGVPAAAAFAAETMGFLRSPTVRVSRSRTWVRLSSEGGHVIVRAA